MRSLLTLAALLAAVAPVAAAEVELQQNDAGWQLTVDGEPFRIKGAGGTQYLDVLAKSGGNTVRTWGVGDETAAFLDEAEAAGLKVVVGIWLEHERKGFDYNNSDEVAAQLEKVREAVETYKDHPAVLAWGIGNEMEGYEAGDDAAIWSAVNSAAALAKSIDPDHPTMTVTAEIGGERVANMHRLCPAIDIVGINSYAGARSLPDRYPQAVPDGYYAKPYVVTEFGPAGTWEVPMNAFDVPEELTSGQKAQQYVQTYEALEGDGDLCLGSFAFLWGAKREATSTWFGMFLHDGSKVAAVDAMAGVWGGTLDNRVPTIEPLTAPTQTGKAGDTIDISTSASDPDGDDVAVEWTLTGEQATYFTGGDTQPELPTVDDALSGGSRDGVTVTLPEEPGVYRLYAVAKDGRNGAATASLPLLVEGVAGEAERAANDAQRATLPLTILADGASSPFVPSGWTGDAAAIAFEPADASNPRSGATSARVNFTKTTGWGGIVWQSPANDWGDVAGGLDLSGVDKLTFWARGETGGETVIFGFGGIGREKPYFDTATGEITVVLTPDWRKYAIDLGGRDLSRIKSGFRWSGAADGKPFSFYLDDVRYE